MSPILIISCYELPITGLIRWHGKTSVASISLKVELVIACPTHHPTLPLPPIATPLRPHLVTPLTQLPAQIIKVNF